MPSADCFSTTPTKKACLCNTVVYLLWGLACSTYCFGERGVCEQLLELCVCFLGVLTACVLCEHKAWLNTFKMVVAQ